MTKDAEQLHPLTTHYETSVILMGSHTLFSDSGAMLSRY